MYIFSNHSWVKKTTTYVLFSCKGDIFMKYEFLIYKIGFLKFMIFIIWFILLFFQLLSLHSNQICNVFQPFNVSYFIFIIPFLKG